MNNEAFRALLTIFMCADPTPASDTGDDALGAWIDRQSVQRGYATWVDAYHRFTVDHPEVSA